LKTNHFIGSADLPGTRADLAALAGRQENGSLHGVSYFLTFNRLRGRLAANSLSVILRQAPLRAITVLFCSGVIWWIVFGVSLGGMKYLHEKNIFLSGDLMGIVFNVLFLALMTLLVFSTGIILYSSLFNSQEASFLLASPAPADKVFAHKYVGAVAFSSWSLLLLGSPILIAYGLVEQAPLSFYLMMPLFFLGFILLPGSVGATIVLLIVNFVPRHRKQVLILGVVGIVLAGSYTTYETIAFTPVYNWDREMLNRLLDRFSFTQGLFVPSHWMTRGLQAAGRGAIGRSLYYLALVWSYGLLFYVVAAGLAVRLYRRGFNRVATGGTLRKRYGGGWVDSLLSKSVGFLHPQVRLLIVKDFRTFRRDPAQWAQILIFSGLMSLYFTNIHRMYLGEVDWAHQNGISLLNLCATGLLLAAYTGRFIYPMLSLEGRKFWILGLLPMRRERLLWGKFAFSAAGGLLIAECLVLLSDVMLGMPAFLIALHVMAVAVLACGLSGLSVGLGACMPNFHETDPSKIAVGFGGTLNLVAGLLFLTLTIALIAAPWHLYAAGAIELNQMYEGNARTAIVLQAVMGVALGVAATVIPLMAGARVLRRIEF
jgi:ABC-2 type transport system permease protein